LFHLTSVRGSSGGDGTVPFFEIEKERKKTTSFSRFERTKGELGHRTQNTVDKPTTTKRPDEAELTAIASKREDRQAQ